MRAILGAIAADATPSRWSLRLSYIEIYNDAVNDLLSGRKNLSLRETSEQRVKVEKIAARLEGQGYQDYLKAYLAEKAKK